MITQEEYLAIRDFQINKWHEIAHEPLSLFAETTTKNIQIVSFDGNSWAQSLPNDDMSNHLEVLHGFGLMCIYYSDNFGYVLWAMPDFVYARLCQLGIKMSLVRSLGESNIGSTFINWWQHEDKILAAMAANPILQPYSYVWGYTSTGNAPGNWGSNGSYASGMYNITITTTTTATNSGTFTISFYPSKTPKAWEYELYEGLLVAD